jgi:hypothetical protein
MTKRQFPFSPRTSGQLEQGDIIAVPCGGGRWACLQVVELKREGVGSRSTLMVGPLPWSGAAPPTDRDVEGLPVTEQGLTRIELFTEGGLQVVANSGADRLRIELPRLCGGHSAPRLGMEDGNPQGDSSGRGHLIECPGEGWFLERDRI